MNNTSTPDRITRRNFLKNTGLIGAGAALMNHHPLVAASNDKIGHATKGFLPKRAEGSRNRHILVIGAGLAGLAAATELKRAGYRVTVLEARTRPGGRVRSVQDPFADNLQSELGAVVFSTAYTTASRYIDHFGLERLDFAFPDLPALYHSGGKRFAAAPGAKVDWPYGLTAEEAELGPIGITLKYLSNTLPENLKDPEQWNSPALRELDKVSLADYLRKQGASEGAIKLIADALYFGWDSENASALSVAVTDIGLFFRGDQMYVLKGGNAQLPTAIASALSTQIEYGTEVSEIQLRDDQVHVSAIKGGRPVIYTADQAICTLPLPVFKGIRVSPDMPAPKKAAMDELPYHEISRIQFQVKSAFWRKEGVSGSATTDLFGGRIDRQPYHDLSASGQRAILDALFIGKDAGRFKNIPDSEAFSIAMEKMSKIHPKLPAFAEGGVVKRWISDPYTLGGWSWPSPGYATQHLDNLRTPFRRLHFAGEHTSMLRATMEGALRSGIRAAGEIDSLAG